MVVYCVFPAFGDAEAWFGHLLVSCCLAVASAAACYLYEGFPCISSWVHLIFSSHTSKGLMPRPAMRCWLFSTLARPRLQQTLSNLNSPFHRSPQSSPFPDMHCSPSLWAQGSGTRSAQPLTPWEEGSPPHSSFSPAQTLSSASRLGGITALCLGATRPAVGHWLPAMKSCDCGAHPISLLF